MAPLRRFCAFPLHHSAAFDPKYSTVSTRSFRRVGRGVGQKRRKRKEIFLASPKITLKSCVAKQRKAFLNTLVYGH